MSTVDTGVYAAVLTPLLENLECDIDLLQQYSEELISRGCIGVALFGTTGEGPSFSVSEKIKTLEGVIAKGLDPSKIIVGNGSANLQDSADLGFKVAEMGCAGYLVAPPCFFRGVEDDGVFRFYEEVILRIGHPGLRVLLYHIPQYTGVPLSAELVQRLQLAFPGVVIGVKESEGNKTLIQEILKRNPKCKVFAGRESFVSKIASLGGAGAVCGLASLYPEVLCDLYKGEASPESIKLLQAFTDSMKDKPFIPFAKALLAKERGEHWLRVRPPLLPFIF
jgi:4-hydroxy-tetrahydrodipicolinate synthase